MKGCDTYNAGYQSSYNATREYELYGKGKNEKKGEPDFSEMSIDEDGFNVNLKSGHVGPDISVEVRI